MTPAEARADLAAALRTEDGVPVYERLPDRWTPPLVVLEPASPWITADDPEIPYGAGVVRFTVRIIGETGTPTEGASKVEDTLAHVLSRVFASPSEWGVENVDAPGTYVVNETVGGFPAVELTVSAPLSLS